MEETKVFANKRLRKVVEKLRNELKAFSQVSSEIWSSTDAHKKIIGHFHAEDILTLRNNFEEVVRTTVKLAVRRGSRNNKKKDEGNVNNKTLHAFMTFSFCLSEISYLVDRIWGLTVDERVLNLLERTY